MKYLRKLLISKDLKINLLKDIEIKELKIRPEEASKLGEDNFISFINFLKVYKKNNVIIGNETEILTNMGKILKRNEKMIPRIKQLITGMTKDNPELREIFKDFIHTEEIEK
jgi:hypothetical protein